MFLAPTWDSELHARYAPLNSTGGSLRSDQLRPISQFDHLKALRASRHALKPLSLYVHLPFCRSRCLPCQRHSVIASDTAAIDQYLAALISEMRLLGQHLDPRQHVERLHLGGGTPTLLSHPQLQHLMQALEQAFTLLDHAADYSIEVDPRQTDWPTMGLLRSLGFNRIQIRVLDLAPKVQQAINRHTCLREVRTLVEAARTLQFNAVSIELTYGLPEQTPESFTHTLTQILSLNPDRITLKPYKPRQPQTATPSKVEVTRMREQSFSQLSQAGFIHLGLEHYVLAYDDLLQAKDEGKLRFDRNGYSSYSACDALGLGVSAISHIQGLCTRNTEDLSGYQTQLGQNELPHKQGFITSLDQRLRTFIIEQLQCQQSLNIKHLEQHFSIDFNHYFAALIPTLKAMASDQLLILAPDKIKLPEPCGQMLEWLCDLFAG